MGTAQKLSVVMPVYNGEGYLAEAIESVLNQTFSDFRFLIVDDASTDGTPALLEKYARQDSRIELLRNPENLRQAKSLNRALRLVTTPYVARQDADDNSQPTRFERQVAILDERPDIALVASHLRWIDPDGKPVGMHTDQERHQEIMHWFMLFVNPLGGGGHVMFRHAAAEKVGFYPENRRFSEDADFWTKLITTGGCYIIPELLYDYRRAHPSSFTARFPEGQLQETLEAAGAVVEQSTGLKLTIDEIDRLRLWSGPLKLKAADEPWVRATVDRLRAAYRPPLPVDHLPQRLRSAISEQWFRVAISRKEKAGAPLRLRCLWNSVSSDPIQPLRFCGKRLLRVARRKLQGSAP